MSSLTHDLRHAFRMLRKNPGFTATVIGVLALGIGGTSVIFAVVNAVLLRPLPLPHPDALVRVFSGRSDGARWTMSPPDFTDIRKDNRVFTDVAAMNEQSFALTGERICHDAGDPQEGHPAPYYDAER